MAAKRMFWRVLSAILAAIGLLAMPDLGSAHPLGNFSISHYTAIDVEPDAVELHYIIDMAEIPTFQELQDAKIAPQANDPGLSAYLSQRVEALGAGLILELNGRRLALDIATSAVIFPPGAGGLPTLKLRARFRARLHGESAAVHELRYRDTNFLGRAGWKEIIVTGGQGIMLMSSSVPGQDRSHELADYPTDLLNSPPQDLEARVVFGRWGGDMVSGEVSPRMEPVRLEANRQPSPRNAFTALVTTEHLGFGIVLVAMAVSVGLGAFHALEPGHGKTVVAAYLVGSRGTAWHAMILGLIVTMTHTVGVYILGAITLFASRYVVPERLYPWLGAISGLIIAALGLSLFLKRYAGPGQAHTHQHGSAHDHTHSPDEAHHHTYGQHSHHAHIPPAISWRALLALGMTGGIVPCPAALVVLLSALSMRRVGFGLLLIVAFSIGLAAVLIAIGILMVYARRLMTRFQGEGVLVSRWLPLTSAAVMTIFGVAIAVQALVSAGIVQIRL
jgi:ABC-type nickel/cobalt efflux system permease component RcnA